MNFLRRPSDFYSGLIFFLIGSLAAIIALDYSLGTARRIGPGGFPLGISSLLALCGLILVARSFSGVHEARIRFASLPLIMISSGIAVFALTLMGAGLVLATIALVLLASAASGRFRPVSALLLALGLAVSCTVSFVYGLGQLLPVFGTWLTHSAG